MLTFDKIKLVSPIFHVLNFQPEKFTKTEQDGRVLYYKYKQEKPYNLQIRIDYNLSEVVLEFTGKILQEDYYKLISKDTFYQCLVNINNLGLCTLDVAAICKDTEVVQCDVTKDIIGDIDKIQTTIKTNISNYNRWIVKQYSNGIVIENIASTSRHKKRVVIYDKYKELLMANNRDLLDVIDVEKFKDTIRFELNVKSKEQIRKLFNIDNNNINSVLYSSENPIFSVIDQALINFSYEQYYPKSVRDFERTLLLKSCENDLAKVEAIVRSLSGKNVSIKRQMQPYKDILNALPNSGNCGIDIRALVM